ncbi:MAG TPA: hypothetical protein VM537_02220, partial [Anaerolineae bacterium]|nr:hypothetical protein [Anaerolineae bacterium]
LEYAMDRNLAPAANATLEDWVVTVDTRSWVDLVFAPIFGVDTVHVDAVAAAACGEARSACGLFPIALYQPRFLELYEGGDGCGRPFFLWNGDNPNTQPNCDLCDCDPIDHDGVNDIVGYEDRTWLDFTNDLILADLYGDNCASSGGCGTSELVCWVENDSPSQIGIDSCVPGDNGTRAALAAPTMSRAGDAVKIPIYDYQGCDADGYCPGGRTYHISMFGCVRIANPYPWIMQFELAYKDGSTGACWKGKVIEVSLACHGCSTTCGTPLPGGPPPAWGVAAVALTR